MRTQSLPLTVEREPSRRLGARLALLRRAAGREPRGRRRRRLVVVVERRRRIRVVVVVVAALGRVFFAAAARRRGLRLRRRRPSSPSAGVEIDDLAASPSEASAARASARFASRRPRRRRRRSPCPPPSTTSARGRRRGRRPRRRRRRRRPPSRRRRAVLARDLDVVVVAAVLDVGALVLVLLHFALAERARPRRRRRAALAVAVAVAVVAVAVARAAAAPPRASDGGERLGRRAGRGAGRLAAAAANAPGPWRRVGFGVAARRPPSTSSCRIVACSGVSGSAPGGRPASPSSLMSHSPAEKAMTLSKASPERRCGCALEREEGRARVPDGAAEAEAPAPSEPWKSSRSSGLAVSSFSIWPTPAPPSIGARWPGSAIRYLVARDAVFGFAEMSSVCARRSFAGWSTGYSYAAARSRWSTPDSTAASSRRLDSSCSRRDDASAAADRVRLLRHGCRRRLLHRRRLRRRRLRRRRLLADAAAAAFAFGSAARGSSRSGLPLYSSSSSSSSSSASLESPPPSSSSVGATLLSSSPPPGEPASSSSSLDGTLLLAWRMLAPLASGGQHAFEAAPPTSRRRVARRSSRGTVAMGANSAAERKESRHAAADAISPRARPRARRPSRAAAVAVAARAPPPRFGPARLARAAVGQSSSGERPPARAARVHGRRRDAGFERRKVRMGPPRWILLGAYSDGEFACDVDFALDKPGGRAASCSSTPTTPRPAARAARGTCSARRRGRPQALPPLTARTCARAARPPPARLVARALPSSRATRARDQGDPRAVLALTLLGARRFQGLTNGAASCATSRGRGACRKPRLAGRARGPPPASSARPSCGTDFELAAKLARRGVEAALEERSRSRATHRGAPRAPCRRLSVRAKAAHFADADGAKLLEKARVRRRPRARADEDAGAVDIAVPRRRRARASCRASAPVYARVPRALAAGRRRHLCRLYAMERSCGARRARRRRRDWRPSCAPPSAPPLPRARARDPRWTLASIARAGPST